MSTESLRFVLVGPGILPIPPTGWGACEILIWDYACELRKLGHHVDITNTKDMDAVVRLVQEQRPDIVHIQYDDFAYIIPRIVDYCRVVALTSHFGYLEQRGKWGGYEHIFKNMICPTYPNYYHLVLSEGIASVYRQHGVDPSKIIVTPNGADASLFRWTDTPRYPDRSIVVGKMEVRKGQYRLQHHQDVWFAGNRHDDSFDYSNPRWLGEWSKPVLYENLTDYGNLVLLSDGEADPLVVKEALVAGLGVVVSEWGAANLDRSQPFITVIPADRLHDTIFIDHAIRENRQRAVQMRSVIREYSKQFEWSNLVRRYVEQLQSKMRTIASIRNIIQE